MGRQQRDLEALAARVEALEGPSREVDAEIDRTLSGNPPGHWYYSFNGLYQTDDLVPQYSASLDAVRKLIDPSDEIEITTLYGVARAIVGVNRDHQAAWPGNGEHKGGNWCLALCAAAVRAFALRRSGDA